MQPFHIVRSSSGTKSRSKQAEQRPTGFQAVARAADILAMFSIDRPALSLAEISERLEVSRPTAHRYATALRQAGLLRQSDGEYTLAPRIVELASIALAGLSVIEVAGPHLERLGRTTRQTTVLSVWDREAPTVVRVHDAAAGRLVRIVVTTGSRLPVESAQGLVFRAYMEPRSRDPRLAEIRRTGSILFPDVVEGISALAAPVLRGEEIVATIALVGTSAALAADPNSELKISLHETANELSLDLGHVFEDGEG